MSALRAPEVFESITLPSITQEQLRRYAEASGDPNPIHLDPEAAKKAGLPGVIAHGMLIAGFLAERAGSLRGEKLGEGWSMRSFQVRFKAMTLLGDVLRIDAQSGEVSEKTIQIDLTAINQRGEAVATAMARFEK